MYIRVPNAFFPSSIPQLEMGEDGWPDHVGGERHAGGFGAGWPP